MRRTLACLALVITVAGCQPGATSPPATAPTIVLPSPSTVVDRKVRLDVPKGMQPQLEFFDSMNGYAMFGDWDSQPVKVVLFGTTDGGLSWKKLTHPRPEAANQQIYVSGPRAVVLLAEPHGWYGSKDNGATWQQFPYVKGGVGPPEYPTSPIQGRFYLSYDAKGEKALIRDRENAQHEGSAPPPGFSSAGLTNAGNRVWLTSIKDGQPITTRSARDLGGFSQVAVPKQPGRNVVTARVVTAGDEVWLFADQDAAGSASGPRGLATSALKATGLPLAWELVNDVWVPRPIGGIKEDPRKPYSIAPMGQHALIIASQGDVWNVQGVTAKPLAGGPRIDHVQRLPDGAILGRTNTAGLMYLGVGTGVLRIWITIEVLRQ